MLWKFIVLIHLFYTLLWFNISVLSFFCCNIRCRKFFVQLRLFMILFFCFCLFVAATFVSTFVCSLKWNFIMTAPHFLLLFWFFFCSFFLCAPTDFPFLILMAVSVDFFFGFAFYYYSFIYFHKFFSLCLPSRTEPSFVTIVYLHLYELYLNSHFCFVAFLGYLFSIVNY